MFEKWIVTVSAFVILLAVGMDFIIVGSVLESLELFILGIILSTIGFGTWIKFVRGGDSKSTNEFTKQNGTTVIRCRKY